MLRLDTRTLTSDNEIRVYGDAIKGQMNLIMEGTGQRQEVTIPWGHEIRGPYAAEQSMAEAHGRRRDAGDEIYIPDLNRVVDFTFKAGAISEIPLGDGSKTLFRKVEQTASLDGKPQPVLDATLWADSGGQVLKLESDMMGGIVMYRTTKEGASRRCRVATRSSTRFAAR